jgi:hypothetical protein
VRGDREDLCHPHFARGLFLPVFSVVTVSHIASRIVKYRGQTKVIKVYGYPIGVKQARLGVGD